MVCSWSRERGGGPIYSLQPSPFPIVQYDLTAVLNKTNSFSPVTLYLYSQISIGTSRSNNANGSNSSSHTQSLFINNFVVLFCMRSGFTLEMDYNKFGLKILIDILGKLSLWFVLYCVQTFPLRLIISATDPDFTTQLCHIAT